jgi:hypothetical protein
MPSRVMQCIGDSNEEAQTVNNNAVHCLTQAGYDAQHLQATLNVKEQEERVTEPNTDAHQLTLVKVKGPGSCFHVTHGAHTTCGDLFSAE